MRLEMAIAATTTVLVNLEEELTAKQNQHRQPIKLHPVRICMAHSRLA